MDFDLIIGFVISWVARKAARIGSRIDTTVDEAIDAGLDAGLDRLHDVVADKLGDDPALRTLENEVAGGADATERSKARVRLALEEAVETDADFASALAAAGDELRGVRNQVVDGVATQGDVIVHAEGGSIAAQVISGGATIGSDPRPPAR